MVNLLLRLTLPELGGRELVDALRSVTRPARLDPECITSQILRDSEAPEAVSYIEEWPSEEALIRRVRSAEFGGLLALMEAASAPPTLEFRFASTVRGLDYVAAVRETRLTPPPQDRE